MTIDNLLDSPYFVSGVLFVLIMSLIYCIRHTINTEAGKPSEESMKRIDEENKAAEDIIKRMIDYSN